MSNLHETLNAISDALLVQHGVIRSCDSSDDASLIMAARFLRDAIDMVDVAAEAAAQRVTSWTPSGYLKKRREAARLTIADVARAIATAPRQAEHLRIGWLELIESDQMPATFNTIVALNQVVPFEITTLVNLSIDGRTPPRLCNECAGPLDPADACRSCADTAEIDALVTRVESAARGAGGAGGAA